MKLLAIDAGNTRIKWAIYDGERKLHEGTLPTAEAHGLEQALRAAPSVERVVIANVAGEEVRVALGNAFACAAPWIWVVGQEAQCGVRSSYADPGQLGGDRWAALIGARRLCEGSCVVVNAGTTMTVDALSADSIFLGGFIVPGFELMRRTLASNTAQLHLREGRFSFFPDTTGDAITSGALNALAGAVDRMCSYMVDSGEDEPLVVISGGDGPLLLPHLSAQTQLVDNLVLEGLARIGMSDV